MRFLTPAEVAKLASAIDVRYRALVLLGAYGGLRVGELCGLQVKDVNLLQRRVIVRSIVTEVESRNISGQPKTSASRRTVPIPEAVGDELAKHLSRVNPRADSPYVFQAPMGGPIRAQSWRKRYWRRC